MIITGTWTLTADCRHSLHTLINIITTLASHTLLPFSWQHNIWSWGNKRQQDQDGRWYQSWHITFLWNAASAQTREALCRAAETGPSDLAVCLARVLSSPVNFLPEIFTIKVQGVPKKAKPELFEDYCFIIIDSCTFITKARTFVAAGDPGVGSSHTLCRSPEGRISKISTSIKSVNEYKQY